MESKNALLFMTLKHTNDIPFEIDLEKGIVSMYFARQKEQKMTICLVDCEPEKLLNNEMIDEDSYENYKYIFNRMMNLQRADLMPVRLKINGIWDINQIYYEVMEQNKIIGCLEDYNEQAFQNAKIDEIHQKSQIDSLTTLYNREGFQYIVEKKLDKLREIHGEGYSALFILDLDYRNCCKDSGNRL